MSLDIAINLLTFLVGLFIGNRLTIGNERRKEFNEAAAPLYISLEVQKNVLNSGSFPNSVLNENDFIGFKRHLQPWQICSFSESVRSYIASPQNCGDYENGRYLLKHPEVFIKAIESVQRYLGHK